MMSRNDGDLVERLSSFYLLQEMLESLPIRLLHAQQSQFEIANCCHCSGNSNEVNLEHLTKVCCLLHNVPSEVCKQQALQTCKKLHSKSRPALSSS